MGKGDKRSSPRQIVDVGDQIILHHTSNGQRPVMNGHHHSNGNGLHHHHNGHGPQVQYLHPNGHNGNGHHHQQQRRSSLSRSRNGNKQQHQNGGGSSQCPSSASSSSPPLPSSSSHNNIQPVNPVTTPICRCRVMYLGSSVPHATKDGLQGIQEPLRDLYPEDGLIKSSLLNGNGNHFPPMNGHPMAGMMPPMNHPMYHHQSSPSSSQVAHLNGNGHPTLPPTVPSHFFPNGPPPPLPPSLPPQMYNGSNGHGHDQQLISLQSSESIGIDSWLSVWSNGILIENVDDSGQEIKKFFPIESLHYCAAVRYVTVPTISSERITKFLPLDSPFSRHTDTNVHPPLFACILRRTTGIKVLECHAFICKREAAANALVRSCFHAYADSVHAKQMNIDIASDSISMNGSTSMRDSDRRSSDRNSDVKYNHHNMINEGRRRSSSQSRINEQMQSLQLVNGSNGANGHHHNGHHDEDDDGNDIKPI